MEHSLFVRLPGCEVWVGKFQFNQWDAFVRRLTVRTFRSVGEEELVPGGPFSTRPEAGQAGMVYARTTT